MRGLNWSMLPFNYCQVGRVSIIFLPRKAFCAGREAGWVLTVVPAVGMGPLGRGLLDAVPLPTWGSFSSSRHDFKAASFWNTRKLALWYELEEWAVFLDMQGSCGVEVKLLLCKITFQCVFFTNDFFTKGDLRTNQIWEELNNCTTFLYYQCSGHMNSCLFISQLSRILQLWMKLPLGIFCIFSFQ